LNVPSEVEMIVRAVYLEKTQTIKSMKRDYELDFITFRKWVIEQKKKTKKDPLPLAKIEVSKVNKVMFFTA
jgi:transposase-like protein